MSDYDRRYNVHANMVSHYTDDPREALRLLDSDPEHGWVAEGYGDVGYQDEHVTEVIRRTIGPVSRGQLRLRITEVEYREHRAKVQQMIRTSSALP